MLVLVGFLMAMVIALVLIGHFYPGSYGMEQLGMRSAREITEQREELEAEDLEQMLAAHNARRRRRGEAEVTVEDLELRVTQDRRELEQRRAAYMADREARRAARGHERLAGARAACPERTHATTSAASTAARRSGPSPDHRLRMPRAKALASELDLARARSARARRALRTASR